MFRNIIIGGLVTLLLTVSYKYHTASQDLLKLSVAIRTQDDLIKEQDKVYRKTIDRINSSYETKISALDNELNGLRKRTKVSILPSIKETGSVNKIRFEREQLDRAIQDFRAGVSEIIEECSRDRVERNLLIEWGSNVR